jgi:hypothetical protein
MHYEPPEILEIAMAEEITRGMGPHVEPDACDCTKRLNNPDDWD